VDGFGSAGFGSAGASRPRPAAEVAAVLAALRDRTGQHVFTVHEIYAEMLSAGTRYTDSTVFRAMQRMKNGGTCAVDRP
jgi:Fe2+ or Zn2+ uptake regulation protein